MYIKWKNHELICKGMCNTFGHAHSMCLCCILLVHQHCSTCKTTCILFYKLHMGYTSPTKVAQIVELHKAGQSDSDIARQVGVDHTTVPHIFTCWEESGDFYYQRPKVGHPWKLSPHDIHHGAHMLATTEVANATELAKQAFPGVSCQTISWELKEHGLICQVHQSRPYISPANQIKWYAWVKEH